MRVDGVLFEWRTSSPFQWDEMIMSSETDRIKHSKRRAKTQSKIKKQVKLAKMVGMSVKDDHRFAKHHALDCGIPNCPVCDIHHTPKRERTIQELRFIDTEKY